MTLTVTGLKKSFGPTEVLKDVSFAVEPGQALGLLGRNGAGKTTTIRIIMQVFPPDGGSVLFGDRPIHSQNIRIGYLPEEKGLYPKQKIRDQLVYLACLRGMDKAGAKKAVTGWLDRMGLADTLDKKLETLSKGNQQKIQLALALLHDPGLIILDEPFSGLDPVNAQLLKTIVREQAALGKTILFSSHQMNYVEQFCESVAILHQGRIQVSGRISDLKRQYPRRSLQLRFHDHSLPADEQMRRVWTQVPRAAGLVRSVTPAQDGCRIELGQESDRAVLFAALAAAGADLEQFLVVEPTLEEIFVDKAGDVS
ncbi:MAG: ATP-binding cassette domain-containing protein [Clostridiaceae bacterium]|nr:ATP-binding cassette domain-containing protein [Clostridiaceae bacterium]